MSPLADLREAVEQLRERAEAATPGPWTFESAVHGYDDKVSYWVLGVTDEDGRTPIPMQTETEDAGNFSQAEADIAYAASLHPLVGLALAQLLEEHADSLEEDGGVVMTSDVDQAVKLARTYLGRQS